jgi:hypothetical protein
MPYAAGRTYYPPEKVQQRQTWKDSFESFAADCLIVKTKAGALEHLKLNSAQQFIHQKLEEQLKRTGKVRALILKARQQGVSTYVGARFYHRTQFFQGTSVFILTQEQAATDTLFSMVDRFHRYMTPEFRLPTGASNAKELTFPAADSGYSVGTAGTRAVGRSKTIQCFHGSEVGFWPSAPEHFAGIVQALPDLPGTEAILESTANGIGGEFHERWQQSERGEGDWIPIFVPWYWSDEYEREPPPDFVLTDEELQLASYYSLTPRKLAWRRYKLSELKDPALFAQEYPATAAEAFQATGHDSFILSRHVMAARKASCEAVGSLVMGVDPARFGDDSFAIAHRRGRVVSSVKRRYRLNTVEGANWVKSEIDQHQPRAVFIDVGNMGAGVIDILRDFGPPYSDVVVSVNFGGAPQDQQRTDASGQLVPGPKNRRAEMWMRSKDWLEDEGGADIPDDDALHADAVAPGYRYDMRQYLLLESKEDIRKRGLRSPDGWDAVALTFAAPVSALANAADSDREWRGRKRGGTTPWGR